MTDDCMVVVRNRIAMKGYINETLREGHNDFKTLNKI